MRFWELLQRFMEWLDRFVPECGVCGCSIVTRHLNREGSTWICDDCKGKGR